nr:glycosyltransferase family 4 protein [uncultured Methanospirillum sp.]
MMRIACVVDEFPPFFRGGLGTYAMEMMPRLRKNGIDISVCSRNTGSDQVHETWNGMPVFRPELMNIHDILPVLSPLDVQGWAPADQNFFLETVLFNQLAADHLIRVHRSGARFDLIVCHDWLSAIAGVLVKRNLEIPFVFHVHSTEQGRRDEGSAVVELIERLAAETADLMVTVSYAMKDELVRNGYDQEKIEVIYNGVDPVKYNPERFSQQMIQEFRRETGIWENNLILFIGRLTQVKGPDELIRAMPAVLRNVPDAQLIILGVGEMEGELHDLIRSLGVDRHVLMHTRLVTEEERLLFYAACDCAVFPSKYEPFGIVCTEAMAMARPVIVGATGTSGLCEQVVSDGPDQCGYHINPWDPDDIATYLVRLLSDQDMMARFGRAGRSRVIRQFTWDTAAARTSAAYRKIQNPGYAIQAVG